MKEHSSDEIGGPDGTYKINRPPKSWQIRELSYGDYLREDIEWVYGKAAPFNDERSKDRHNSSFGKVLLLERGNRVTWIPRPGETKLNGRELMSATGDCFQTQVAIFPISRFSQVRAAEASFYSNAVLALTQEAGPTTISMLDLDKGTGGRRPKLLAELRGIIENVYIFERQEVVTVEGHTRFLAVNGDIEDYALVAYDYTIIDKKGNRTESSAEVLNDILNSFPL